MPTLLTVALLFSIPIIAYGLRTLLQASKSDTPRLPGPSSYIASFLWGHELLAFHHESTHMYSTWARALGGMYKIKAAFFHPDILVATDHAAVQHIFAESDVYVKSPSFRPPIAALLGKGLVWAEGEDHKKQRRILKGAFSQESIRNMSSDISECAERLSSNLTLHLLSQSGSEANPKGSLAVNIVEWTSACTLDIIGRVAFGHDFSTPPTCSPSSPTSYSNSSIASRIHQAWTRHVRMGLTPVGFLSPLLIRTFPWIVKVIGVMRVQGEIRKVVRCVAGKVVEEHRRVYGSGNGMGQGKDILSILMRNQGDGLSDEQILDNISTFAMVGHETTASSLNFTLLQLARHPNHQARLREEILSHGQDLSYDDLNGERMAWLDAVVKEGLRLHPASPQTERVALQEDVIPLSKPIRATDGQMIGEVRITKGQVIHIPFTTINTNPSVWGPDAGIFNPERWIKPGGIPKPGDLVHGWSGLSTFCDGPRNCIGWRLAIFEFKVILATLIRSLEFHATNAVVQQKTSPTLQPVTDGTGGLLPLFVSLV